MLATEQPHHRLTSSGKAFTHDEVIHEKTITNSSDTGLPDFQAGPLIGPDRLQIVLIHKQMNVSAFSATTFIFNVLQKH